MIVALIATFVLGILVGVLMNENAYDYANQSSQLLDDGSFEGFFPALGNSIGNMFTGDVDYKRSLETLGYQNAFNASEAQKQRDFEERMANTAYQRAAADMKAAGYNPALMFSQGGAATPTGSSARSGSGGAPSSGNGLTSLLGTIISSVFKSFTAYDKARLDDKRIRDISRDKLIHDEWKTGQIRRTQRVPY